MQEWGNYLLSRAT